MFDPDSNVEKFWKNHFISSYKNRYSWANSNYSIKTEVIKSDQNKQAGHTRLKLHCFCPDDKTLVTVDDQDYITLWKIDDNEFTRQKAIAPDQGITGIQSVSMSKNLVVIKAASKGVVLYEKSLCFDASNFKTILSDASITATDGMQFLKFRSDQDFVLFDENFMYNFVKNTQNPRYQVSKVSTNYSSEDLCCFDCCENFCAAGSWNGEVNLWKLDGSNNEPKILISHSEVIYDIKFSKDLLITGGGDGKLCIHGNLDSDGEVRLLSTIHFSTDVVKISTNEYYLAAATDNEVKVYHWNKICKNIYEPVSTISSQNGSIMGSIRAMEFSQAGRLVIASSQRRVSIWSCLENRQLGVIHHNPLLVGSIYVGAKFVLIASKDRPGAVSYIVYK